MKLLKITNPVVIASFFAAFGLSMAGCPPPAAIHIVNPASVPPLCSEDVRTIRVSLTSDPEIPSAHGNSIQSVEWDIAMKCAIGPPTNESNGGRNGNSCHVFQAVGGGQSYAGGCMGPGVSEPLAAFHLVRTTSNANNMNFDFATTQGNICVRATVNFSDGTPPLTIPWRMWRVPALTGEPIPDIGFTLRNSPTEPFPYMRSSSAEGCPNT
jgi:hypothetical protein